MAVQIEVDMMRCGRGDKCVNPLKDEDGCLPASEFNADSGKDTGRQSYCKACRAKYDFERRLVLKYLGERQWPAETMIGTNGYYSRNATLTMLNLTTPEQLTPYNFDTVSLNGRTFYLARNVRRAVKRRDVEMALMLHEQDQARREAEKKPEQTDTRPQWERYDMAANEDGLYNAGLVFGGGAPLFSEPLEGKGGEITLTDEWMNQLTFDTTQRVIETLGEVLKYLLCTDLSKGPRLLRQTEDILKEMGLTDDDIDALIAD